ncbi:MAG: peptidylprolyl isomerase [Candidatus Lindowbacteria bacterium]|nr:peptidylprolyl isomerase [Candidatus Lindowbacteria bacterium]
MQTGRGKWFLALAIAVALAWCVSGAWAADKEQAPAGQEQAAAQEKESPAETEKPSTAPEQSAEAKQPAEDKIASVNGVIIKRSDFDREAKRLQRQVSMMGKPLAPSEISDMRKEVLDNLIGAELLYQESQKAGIKVEETAINEKIDALKKRFPAETDYQNWLAKMGATEVELKSQLERRDAVELFVNKEVVEKISVPEEEMKDFYDKNPDFFKQPEQVKASHILIKVDQNADPAQKAEARKKIEEIQQKLKEGADFAELGKEHSDCPSKVKGGDLGYFRRGQMVKPFEEAAFALNPGEMSDIVETNFGFHIIKVTDKKSEGTTPYDEVKARLETYLKQQKVQDAVSAYVDKLEENAKIERYLEEPAAEASEQAPAAPAEAPATAPAEAPK